jgi:hypothetical protein
VTLWGKRRRKKATWCGLKPLKMKQINFLDSAKPDLSKLFSVSNNLLLPKNNLRFSNHEDKFMNLANT